HLGWPAMLNPFNQPARDEFRHVPALPVGSFNSKERVQIKALGPQRRSAAWHGVKDDQQLHWFLPAAWQLSLGLRGYPARGASRRATQRLPASAPGSRPFLTLCDRMSEAGGS